MPSFSPCRKDDIYITNSQRGSFRDGPWGKVDAKMRKAGGDLAYNNCSLHGRPQLLLRSAAHSYHPTGICCLPSSLGPLVGERCYRLPNVGRCFFCCRQQMLRRRKERHGELARRQRKRSERCATQARTSKISTMGAKRSYLLRYGSRL